MVGEMKKNDERKLVYVETDKLIPYANNAKVHGDVDVDAVMASIQRFGFTNPILTWKGIVVAGHGRLLAAKRLGLEKVPTIPLDYMTDEERRAYILADNRIAELSGWDFNVQSAELAEISEIDMSEFGFDDSGISESATAQDDGYNPVVPESPRSEKGQIWVLGNHRLMCGDSANADDMRILMGGVNPVLVFTDPPYGVAIGDKNKMLDEVAGGKSGRVKTNIEGDTLSKDELYEVLLQAFTNLRENCADDCTYYVTSPQGGEIGLMMMMMRDAGLEVRHNLIWEKSSATFSMGRLDYDYKHEPIFYTWTKRHNFYGKGQYRNTVWQFPKPRHCDLHPTMKPVELVAECLLNSSKEGDAVADIFGGSGTTMIACEQLGRRCYMMEKDPHYCDVIIDRWEQFTGKKAELIG